MILHAHLSDNDAAAIRAFSVLRPTNGLAPSPEPIANSYDQRDPESPFAQQAFDSGVGVMKKKGRVIEREDQECLERSNMQLNKLRSIQTATKKRRALKGAASNPALTKSIHSASAKDCMSTPATQASS
jgi:hypothetical protein